MHHVAPGDASWQALVATNEVEANTKVADGTFTQGGEIGAAQWHYSIGSTRSHVAALDRIAFNQELQLAHANDDTERERVKQQKERLQAVLKTM